MNVLSLFDGISCGQLALQRAGIKVSKYFASEVDADAIKVTQHHFPNTVQLNCVRYVRGADLPKIDLLLGGSPCQGFSFAGKRLNFDDPRSKLFFEYVRIKKECNPRWFLLENVMMGKEHEDVISSLLGVWPIKINSSLVSAQNRKRLYWTNIPVWGQPKDKGLLLKDVIEEGYVDRDKSRTICASNYPKGISFMFVKMNQGGQVVFKIGDTKLKYGKYGYRLLTPLECERLQTLPDNYTRVHKKLHQTMFDDPDDVLIESHRGFMLGNCWTVDVIVHILKGIKNETTRINRQDSCTG